MRATERNELVISWLTISVAFAWAFSGGLFNVGAFLPVFAISLVGVGTGFILHELAHKYVAIHYGAHAEFKLWQTGLILALVMAVIARVVFAAPGAVYIMGDISRTQNGHISLAGPATNVLLALLFMGAAALVSQTNFLYLVFSFSSHINLWLATFNLIPIYPLDGSKVFAWSPVIWGLFFVPLALTSFGII